MDFNFSNSTKKSIAEQSLEMLNMNLYRAIVLIGEDPEEFDMSLAISSVDPDLVLKYDNIKSINNRILNIKALIESLN